MSEKEKVFDTNDIISCFKMSVDVNGIKRIEEYINKLEQENKILKDIREIAINYIDQVIMYKPCAREIDKELDTLIGILRGKYDE